MPNLGKMAGLAMTGSLLVESLLLRRFLLGMAVILVLGVIAGVMISALVIVGFYVAYRLLLQYGTNMDTALLAMCGVAVVFILALAAVIVTRFRAIRKTLRPKPDVVSRVRHVGEAFVEGLLAPSVRKE